jgi:nicotinamidase-related amidase
MSRKALVVIDIQNDITKHYREIIDRINDAIDWAVENGLEVKTLEEYKDFGVTEGED